MKLRIRGHSLRLRLTQSEVQRLGTGVRVEETISFSPDQHLVYAIETSTERAMRASFDAGEVRVVVPRDMARAWAEGDEVSLEATQPIGAGASLAILVEKDFACLKPRSGEDDADAFPHPAARS